MPDENEPSAKSWLDEKLERLNAVYGRFGRDGLREFPLGDVGLLLSSKELAFRDAPKGRDLNEDQKESNRRLELEIRDLAGYLNSQFVQMNPHLPRGLQRFTAPQQNDRPHPPRQHDKGREPER